MKLLENGRGGSSHKKKEVGGTQNIYIFGLYSDNHNCNSKALVITRIRMLSAVIY